VRQFIAKVVLNRPDVFKVRQAPAAPKHQRLIHCIPFQKDFASTWFEPLARLAVSKDNGGSGFNYFVRDICLLFLRWNHFAPAAHQKPIVNAFMVLLPRQLCAFLYLCTSHLHYLLLCGKTGIPDPIGSLSQANGRASQHRNHQTIFRAVEGLL
jgi:hypothetical protein